jgi:hypothetical protein
MNKETPLAFGEEQANALLEAGWRQCQIFRPNATLPYHEVDVFFVVFTQSCSVVSPSITRDPFVEIGIGRPLAKFQSKCQQARGRDVRKYHLPINGPDFEALEIDINSRQFVNRELLLGIEHSGLTVSDQARRDFAGWIARYYFRIALPNELVARLRILILEKLKQFLESKDGNPPAQRHEQVAGIWIRYSPDEELPKSKDYDVSFLILCDEPEIAEDYDRKLLDLFGSQSLSVDGITFNFDVSPSGEIMLTDLNGWIRFTDWDYLSGMGDAAAIPTSP